MTFNICETFSLYTCINTQRMMPLITKEFFYFFHVQQFSNCHDINFSHYRYFQIHFIFIFSKENIAMHPQQRFD
jgi:hypothetical protein